jgi:hypothetical protein
VIRAVLFIVVLPMIVGAITTWIVQVLLPDGGASEDNDGTEDQRDAEIQDALEKNRKHSPALREPN